VLSPIVLFVYNRLSHTKQTVESLKKNDLSRESDLFIFSDGPKVFLNNEQKNIQNKIQVQEVRDYIKTINGFKKVTIFESEKNKGLADSIISGVTQVINDYGTVIVLEDDMLTSPHFLKYMNDALNCYENEENVISIHGYIYPVKGVLPETFFLKGADCWGWATWKRGWDLFESDGGLLLNELEKNNLIKEFDFNGTVSYSNMLRDQIIKKNNSWAIRWYASAFLKNKFTLYPGISLIKNIGLDDSGTNCAKTDKFNDDNDIFSAEVKIKKNFISEDVNAKKKIETYFKNLSKYNNDRILSKLFSFVDKINLKDFIPPIFYKIKNKIFKKNIEIPEYGWFGNYPDWESAKNDSGGYDNDLILEKVKSSLLKVKNGEAPYERDSVLFDKIEYSWPLLSCLLWIASINQNKLNVLDFGGSLGSSYYQNNYFLKHLANISWNIVEQQKFVECGRKYFEDDILKFYYSIDECIKEKQIDIIILSSVLQYMEKPYEIMMEIIKHGIKCIIVDLTGFMDKERIMIQKIPPSIYEACYPVWILEENKLLKCFENDYKLIETYDSFIGKELYLNDGSKFSYKGFIFIKNN
jgi:putative methyltransferase (TIGR04325 family)